MQFSALANSVIILVDFFCNTNGTPVEKIITNIENKLS